MTSKKTKNSLFPYLKLILGFIVIWAGMQLFAMFLMKTTHSPVMEYIQEKDVDASALFYTESETSLECHYYMLKEK
jgi:hypothetical protein